VTDAQTGAAPSDALLQPAPLLLEVADGIATLTLNRPEALNALDRALKDALLDAVGRVARDEDVRVVVVTGAGRAFCSGQDLREGGGAASLAVELRDRYNPLILGLRRMEKPVIAAVNGVAAGAGVSLALACDLRIAAEEASFVLAFGRIGLVPDSGLTWFLPRLVGPARAAELMFSSDPVSAQEAARLGLVNRAVPGSHLKAETASLAARLASAAPRALGLAKRALNRALEVGLEDALAYEASLQGIAGATADHQEGIRAFREKRTPRFHGK
jgi:2-(1,2-epoxy-1,2-dihydrophenyl)acetyl-CoA isomerase